MLLQTLQMFKKSRINKGNAMTYLAFIVRIVHVCVENQTAVRPRDAISRKEEEPARIFCQLKPNTQHFLLFPYESPTPPPKKKIFSYFELIPGVYFCLFYLFYFWELNFTYFLIIMITIRCSGTFHVPRSMFHVLFPCSFFHVPGSMFFILLVSCSWFYRRLSARPLHRFPDICVVNPHTVSSSIWN